MSFILPSTAIVKLQRCFFKGRWVVAYGTLLKIRVQMNVLSLFLQLACLIIEATH